MQQSITTKLREEGYQELQNNSPVENSETQKLREKKGLKKSSNKSAEHFNSHCVDSFVIASEISNAEPNYNILVVDDTYRPIRRRLHDTQFKKGGIREKYSSGNFKGIQKGCICDFGQIVGGTEKVFYIRNSENKRIGRTNISWLSHNFKLKGNSSPEQVQGFPCQGEL